MIEKLKKKLLTEYNRLDKKYYSIKDNPDLKLEIQKKLRLIENRLNNIRENKGRTEFSEE